jgi:hypothetical protein
MVILYKSKVPSKIMSKRYSSREVEKDLPAFNASGFSADLRAKSKIGVSMPPKDTILRTLGVYVGGSTGF